MTRGPTKARIALRLRAMARAAASPDFAAGLAAAADMLDEGAGARLHECKLPRTGHYHECQVCGLKWYGFHKPVAKGATTVEWVTKAPIAGLVTKAAS